MNEAEKLKAMEITKELRDEIRALINKHATAVNALATQASDPHSTIIGCVQMALAQSAFNYLCTCGAKPPEALIAVSSVCAHSMQQWMHSLLKTRETAAPPAAKPTPKRKIIRP